MADSRRLVGLVAVAAVISSGLLTVSGAAYGVSLPKSEGVVEALDVAAPRLVSGVDRAEVSMQVAKLIAPESNGHVFLAAAGDSRALGQAAANASQAGGLAIGAAGTTAGPVLAQLDQFQVTEVSLVGPASAFPSDLVAAIRARYSVNDDTVGDTAFDWSTAVDDPTARTEIVVGNTNSGNSIRAAVNLATVTGASLLLVDDSTNGAALAAILDDPSNELITVMGGNSALKTFDSLSDATVGRIVSHDVTSLVEIERTVVYSAVAGGHSTRRVVASTANDSGSLGPAGLLARHSGGVVISAGSAPAYIGLLSAPMTSLSVVGVGATEAKATELESAQTAQAGFPSWRVADTTLTSTGFTVSYNAVSGATRYVAHDLTGAQVATSTTTQITIPGAPASTAITARDASGANLRTLQYKVNEFSAAEDRPQAIIGSTSSPTNYMKFLGPQNVPRLISRLPISLTGEAPDPDSDTVPISVTCKGSFVDHSQPKTSQYQYRVTVLSTNPASCEATGNVPDPAIRDVGGVTFPATEVPAAALAADETVTVGEGVSTRASGSLLERAVATQFARNSDKSGRALAPGDDWDPVKFRYQAFIPEDKLWAPGSTGTISRPFQFFEGDNRYHNPNGTYRYRMDATVYFGSEHRIAYSEWMGQSVKFACRWPNGTDCIEQQRATAPLSELRMQDTSSADTSAHLVLAAAGTNPLHRFAPPIDGAVGFTIRPGGTTIRGVHDRMPVHEVWYTVVGWGEWYFAYGSDEWFAACLHANVAPGCTARFNVRV